MTLLPCTETHSSIRRSPSSPRKLIGTTLLVKRQEYDHAVILDADTQDAKDLRIAMTRVANTLTIVGEQRHLPAR